MPKFGERVQRTDKLTVLSREDKAELSWRGVTPLTGKYPGRIVSTDNSVFEAAVICYLSVAGVMENT